MKKMKICHFGHKSILERSGGVEVVVYELATRMAKRGYDVTCYNRSGHHVSGREFDAKKQSVHEGVRLKYVPTVQKRGLAAVSSSVFASVFAALSANKVVHIHAEGPAFMCWLPRLLGKRVIVTVHGLDHQRAKWGRFARTYIMMGEKNAVRFANEIIVLSKGVEQYFEKNYGRKTYYIPNGVTRPEKAEAQEITSRFGLEKDSYILFLGRIVPEKGLDYLIEAFKSVKTDKKLVIAGGSSDTQAYYEKLKAAAADDGRIVFTGFVQGRTLAELYSNAYVYTLPSDLEGMPLSLLEAMSYGNCCLVSDIAECTEVIGGHGMVFRKSDVQDLREKLQYLCDHETETDAIKAESADYICEAYNWDTVVDETLRLYQRGMQ